MMRLLTCLALLLSASAAAAQGQQQPRPISLTTPLVADLSQNTVEIQSNFNGAQLLVFGARNAPGDLVVAVRGPDSKVMLRRKERIAGMWMHVEQRKYLGVPAFYAIASTRPLDQIIDPHLRDALGLGEASVTAFANNVPNPLFDSALQETLMRKRWWQLPFARITYFGESLFKARIDLPDTLPGGDYTAEVYLFDRGKLYASQTIPLTVYKTGIEAHIYDSAHKHSAAYGIVAVLLALFGGWLGHRLFHR